MAKIDYPFIPNLAGINYLSLEFSNFEGVDLAVHVEDPLRAEGEWTVVIRRVSADLGDAHEAI